MERPTIRATVAAGGAAVLLGSFGVSAAPARVAETCFGATATIVGTDGIDTLVGTSHRDVIVGLGGNDVIYGSSGDDLLCGRAGADRIFGGRGDDRILGGPGSDYLSGWTGRDRIFGGSGDDRLRGGTGGDRGSGGPGLDRCLSPTPPAATSCENTTRVSVASNGQQVYRHSRDPALSADGRYVAFNSTAAHVVSGDTNRTRDVFVHDRRTGATTRVSVASDGSQANKTSGYFGLAISQDGRYIAFTSLADALVPGDTNGNYDVFVHDRQTGATTRVSVVSDGNQAAGFSFDPVISADGRYVAFVSYADNLVPGDTTATQDVFVHDRRTGATTRVSVASDGSRANDFSELFRPVISGDGRYIAFSTDASNLVPGDTNATQDVFVHDRQTGDTSRVSVASDGSQANSGSQEPALSADGRYIAFTSTADNLVPGDTNGTEDVFTHDVFVHDRQTGTTTRVSVASDGSQANEPSQTPALSADGRYIAFTSSASNLVPRDTNRKEDLFVHDRHTRSHLNK
ncbi:MAG: hypothetical protein ACRDUA_13565 [Micromonosporaceae bacterium]